MRAQEGECTLQVERARVDLTACTDRRAALEAQLAVENQRLADALRAAADRREGLARLGGHAGARRSRVEAGEDEIARLGAALAQARARADAAQHDVAAVQTRLAGFDRVEEGLDAAHENAVQALALANAAVEALQHRQRGAERDRATLTARKEALELGLARDGAVTLLAATPEADGVIGSVAALLTRQPGCRDRRRRRARRRSRCRGGPHPRRRGDRHRSAQGAGRGTGRPADRRPHDGDHGRAGGHEAGGADRVGDQIGDRPDRAAVRLPGGACWALDLIQAPAQLRSVLARLLHRVVVADGLAIARAVVADAVASGSPIVAVTREGDLLGDAYAAGGSARTPSRLEVQVAVDEAEAGLRDAVDRVERAVRELIPATRARRARAGAGGRRAHPAARVRLPARGSARTPGPARLRRPGGRRGGRPPPTRHRHSAAGARCGRGGAGRARGAPGRRPGGSRRRRCGPQHVGARAAHACVRPGPGGGGRGEAGTSHPGGARRAVAGAPTTRSGLSPGSGRPWCAQPHAGSTGPAAPRWRARLRTALDRPSAGGRVVGRGHPGALSRRGGPGRAREQELEELRARSRELGAELDQLVDSVHRDEVARAEQRLRIETRGRVRDELGMDPDVLIDEYGPQRPVADHCARSWSPYDRAEQEKRLRRAERDLAALGRVNPLALEEFAALEERHRFLGVAA